MNAQPRAWSAPDTLQGRIDRHGINAALGLIPYVAPAPAPVPQRRRPLISVKLTQHVVARSPRQQASDA